MPFIKVSEYEKHGRLIREKNARLKAEREAVGHQVVREKAPDDHKEEALDCVDDMAGRGSFVGPEGGARPPAPGERRRSGDESEEVSKKKRRSQSDWIPITEKKPVVHVQSQQSKALEKDADKLVGKELSMWRGAKIEDDGIPITLQIGGRVINRGTKKGRAIPVDQYGHKIKGER